MAFDRRIPRWFYLKYAVHSNILLFLAGFLIGFVLIKLLSFELDQSEEEVHEVIEKYKPIETKVVKLHQPRILCVLKSQEYHRTNAIQVQHCDKLLFASTVSERNLDAIGFSMKEEYDHLWGKVKFIFHYVYKNFIDEHEPNDSDITFEDGIHDEGRTYEQMEYWF